jgi:hypothetical protein
LPFAVRARNPSPVIRSSSRLLASFPLLLAARALSAQPPAESGIARDATLRTPLECLHVALIDAEEHAVAHAVTDSAGTFVLVAPSPGVYRVGFEIFGWEPLAGPLDTLRAGEMREREYPLEFTRLFGSDSVASADLVTTLRRREGPAWRSALAATPDAQIRYPRQMLAGRGSGVAVAQYVVDDRGRVRADSWRPIEFTNGEFLSSVRAHVPAMRYQPAQLDGRPVCQLVRNQVRFDWGPVPYITMFN